MIVFATDIPETSNTVRIRNSGEKIIIPIVFDYADQNEYIKEIFDQLPPIDHIIKFKFAGREEDSDHFDTSLEDSLKIFTYVAFL